MVSEDNLEWLRQDGRKYLVGAPKSDLNKWQQRIVEQDGWREIREGIEVKLCAGPEEPETFILCRSARMKQKELAMHEIIAQRIRQALESLAGRLERARKPVDAHLVERQIGWLLQRNTRAAGGFDIHVSNAPERASGLRLRWKLRAEWLEWARQTEGVLHPENQRLRMVLRGAVEDLYPAVGSRRVRYILAPRHRMEG